MDNAKLLFLFLVICIVAYQYLVSNRKASQEKHLKPLLSIRCGGSFGWTSYPTPFVRHEVYDDFLVISYGNKNIVLFFKEICSVTKPWYLFGQQIKYIHTNKEIPKNITVRAWRLNELLKVLKSKGLNIEN